MYVFSENNYCGLCGCVVNIIVVVCVWMHSKHNCSGLCGGLWWMHSEHNYGGLYGCIAVTASQLTFYLFQTSFDNGRTGPWSRYLLFQLRIS